MRVATLEYSPICSIPSWTARLHQQQHLAGGFGERVEGSRSLAPELAPAGTNRRWSVHFWWREHAPRIDVKGGFTRTPALLADLCVTAGWPVHLVPPPAGL